MATKKKPSKTQTIAKKKKRNTTSKDVPGVGSARKAAKAIERRRQMLRDI